MTRLTEATAPERVSDTRPADPKPFNPAAIAQTIRPKPTPARTAAVPGGAATPGVTAAAPVHRPKPAPYPPTQTSAPATSTPATLPPLQTAPVPAR